MLCNVSRLCRWFSDCHANRTGFTISDFHRYCRKSIWTGSSPIIVEKTNLQVVDESPSFSKSGEISAHGQWENSIILGTMNMQDVAKKGLRNPHKTTESCTEILITSEIHDEIHLPVEDSVHHDAGNVIMVLHIKASLMLD
jgi:hypothetical protein